MNIEWPHFVEITTIKKGGGEIGCFTFVQIQSNFVQLLFTNLKCIPCVWGMRLI